MHQTNKQTFLQSLLKPGRAVLGIALLATFVFGSSCQKINETTEIKLAHALEVTHPVHKAMVFMAKTLEEKSGGKMTMEVYPNGQLGSERECLELLQIGSLGMTKVSAAVLESFSPNFKVLSLPYIFKDKDHYYRVLDGPVGDQILTEGEKYFFKGLTYYDAGSRSFYTTNKPVETPADLRGMNIRVQPSTTAIAMINAFGGAATPTAWGELYTALQQGVVDGAENNLPSFYLSRHYEVAKYLSLNEHTMVPDLLMISTVVWESLTDQERKWLQEAADASAVEQRKLWALAETEAMEAIVKGGVQVTRPNKEPFSKLVEHMYDTYKGEPEVYSLIKRIQAAEAAPAPAASAQPTSSNQ